LHRLLLLKLDSLPLPIAHGPGIPIVNGNFTTSAFMLQPLPVPSPLLLLPFAPTVLASHVGTGRDNNNAVYATSSTAALAIASPRAATMATDAAGLQPTCTRLATHLAST
jgi:hypothetical protein